MVEGRDGIDEARTALAAGRLVILPTETVYGLAADAADPAATAESSKRIPPHTPSSAPSPVQPEGEGDKPLFDMDDAGAAASSLDLQRPPELEMAASPSPKPEKKPSSLGRTFLLLILVLVLAGGGLVAYAFVQTGDPNPLPIIDQLLNAAEKAAAGR